jgi:hypothetical protein
MYARRTRPDPSAARSRLAAAGIVGAVAVAAVALLGGCATGATSEVEGAVGPTPTVTALPLTIPEPKGASVLTISGKIDTANQGDTMVLDESAVAGLAKIDLTFADPFQKKALTLKGVWLADLLDAADIAEDATKVHMTALDDYVIEFTMDEVRAGGMFLAVADQRGGALSLENGGPTRIVFVDGTPAGANSDKWIWSLATIEVQ